MTTRIKKANYTETVSLRCSPATIHWGYLSAAIKSVAQIQPGQTIKIDTVSGGVSRLPSDRETYVILPDHQSVLSKVKPHLGPHILTGPLDVEGAKKGDLLVVDIHEINLRQNWGWNEITLGTGVLPELEGDADVITIPIDIKTQRVRLPWAKTSVRATPFFGVMAVKPPIEHGERNSLIPGCFGGNIDIPLLQKGMRVYLPIQVNGAGFSVGDGHALQGDGEVSGTAVETALSGIFQINTTSNFGVKFPFMKKHGHLIATAVSENLDEAIKIATKEAVRLLVRFFEIREVDAYKHLSLLANVRIAQVVNISKGVYIDIDTRSLKPRKDNP